MVRSTLNCLVAEMRDTNKLDVKKQNKWEIVIGRGSKHEQDLYGAMSATSTAFESVYVTEFSLRHNNGQHRAPTSAHRYIVTGQNSRSRLGGIHWRITQKIIKKTATDYWRELAVTAATMSQSMAVYTSRTGSQRVLKSWTRVWPQVRSERSKYLLPKI